MDIQAVRRLIHQNQWRPPTRRPPSTASLRPASSEPRTPFMRAWLVAAHRIVLCAAFVPAPSMAQTPADVEQVAKGESVYGDYCWTCHGERLSNPGGGTSSTFDGCARATTLVS